MIPFLLVAVSFTNILNVRGAIIGISSLIIYLLLSYRFTLSAICTMYHVSLLGAKYSLLDYLLTCCYCPGGTKGSDKAEALPSISSKKTSHDDGQVVEEIRRVCQFDQHHDQRR
jgi:hypothetical protein